MSNNPLFNSYLCNKFIKSLEIFITKEVTRDRIHKTLEQENKENPFYKVKIEQKVNTTLVFTPHIQTKKGGFDDSKGYVRK